MTTLAQMSAAEYQKEVKFNENLAAVATAGAFGRRFLGQTSLTWAFYGGVLNLAGVLTVIADGTVALTGGAGGTTNYIEMTPLTGAVTANTTGWTAGKIPLYTAVANSTSNTITSWVDYRSFWPEPMIAPLSMTADANFTPTAAQTRGKILSVTSTVSLTVTRNVVLPIAARQWTVFNGTTGAQALQFIGSTGTGITVANGMRAILYADGTNIVRVTPDA